MHFSVTYLKYMSCSQRTLQERKERAVGVNERAQLDSCEVKLSKALSLLVPTCPGGMISMLTLPEDNLVFCIVTQNPECAVGTAFCHKGGDPGSDPWSIL